MPRGAVGLAVKAWRLWRRLPPERRKQLLEEARRQAPKALSVVRGKARRLS